MADPGKQTSEERAFLLEYQALKAEQLARIQFRDRQVAVLLGLVTAIFTYSFGAEGRHSLVLTIPVISFVFCLLYARSDQKISAIGEYIRTRDIDGHFQWERFYRGVAGRRHRKLLQFAADLTVFCLPPVAICIISGLAIAGLSATETVLVWTLLTLPVFCTVLIYKQSGLGARSTGENDPK